MTNVFKHIICRLYRLKKTVKNSEAFSLGVGCYGENSECSVLLGANGAGCWCIRYIHTALLELRVISVSLIHELQRHLSVRCVLISRSIFPSSYHRCKAKMLRCRNNLLRFVEAVPKEHPVW